MSPREAVSQALRLLLAHPLRSALTMFGLVWGTAAVIFLMGWGRGTQTMLQHAFDRTGRNMAQAWAGKVSEDFSPAVDRRYLWFTLDDVEALRRRAKIPEIIGAENRRYAPIAYRQRAFSFEVRGTDPQTIAIRGAPVAVGRTITREDLEQRSRVAVLGHDVRKKLLGAEGHVGSRIRIDGTPFRVVGVLGRVGTQLNRDGDEIDDQVWVPLSTQLGLWPNEYVDQDVVRSIVFRVRDRSRIADARREVRAILADRLGVPPTDEEAIHIWSPIEMLMRLPVGQQNAVNVLIAITTLVIGGIGILSMMLDAVRERRPEIGIRLAVGARRRDILAQFFLETLAIVLLGGALGVALGVGGCLLLGSDAFRAGIAPDLRDLVPAPELSAAVIVVAVSVMSAVGVTAGLVPAWRAAQVDPAETLREE